MEAAMFQLRSFVHQRLYSAAEEILGEVHRTLILAVHEAEVGGCKEEAGGLQHRLVKLEDTSEPLLTYSPVDQADVGDVSLLQEDPEEAPGPSQPSAVSGINNYCFVQSNFEISVIKEEQEECDDGSETQGDINLPHESVKTEQHQSEIQVSDEMQLISSAQSENSDDAEEEGSRRVDHTTTITLKGGKFEVESGSVLPHDSQKNNKACSFCHVCGKGFRYIGSLTNHLKTHKRKRKCTICGVTFMYKKALISHINARHYKAHCCSVCGKTFTYIRRLQQHERMHAVKEEFMCQQCGKTFPRRENLVAHVRTHSGEKPYQCDICGKAYCQSSNLTIHKRCHSGEKPYHCALCGKQFTSSTYLKKHMRWHSGEKPFPCDFCGKCFHDRGHMTRHRTTHTGERLYACQVCGMRYRSAQNLKLHMQKVHMQTHEIAATERKQLP